MSSETGFLSLVRSITDWKASGPYTGSAVPATLAILCSLEFYGEEDTLPEPTSTFAAAVSNENQRSEYGAGVFIEVESDRQGSVRRACSLGFNRTVVDPSQPKQ